MDTSYLFGTSIGSDMDLNGMFDQYMHKQYPRYDTALAHSRVGMNPPDSSSVGGDGSSPTHPSHHPSHQQLGLPPHQQQMYSHQGHHGVDMGNNPHFPPQHLYIPPIGGQAIASTGYMPHPGMLSSSNPVYTSPHPTLMGRGGQSGPMGGGAGGLMGGGLMGGYYHPSAPGGGASSAPGGTGESPASGGSPSPGSEDSNDGSAVPRHNKRPSPDTGDVPAMGGAAGGGGGAGRGKKPKLSKKNKKKKDPNEPHKPVSAYALFFRDTQANIRGQNPNASFGEVSKIVASLWDSLDADNKNVYKKKTEAAKKEYLKALAAYRASLVSKGGEGDTKYPGAGQNFPPHYGQAYSGGQAYPGGLNPQMSQQQPPQQPPSMSLSHTSIPPQQLSPHTTSPHLNPLMDGSSLLSPPPMSQPMPPMPPQHPSMGGHGAPPPGGYMAQQASPSVGSPSSLASASTSPAPPHPMHHTPHSPHLYTQAQHSPPQQHLQQQQQHYTHQHQQASPEHHLQHHHQQQVSPSHHPNSSPTSVNCNNNNNSNSTSASSPSHNNSINNNVSSLSDVVTSSNSPSTTTATNISTTMSVTATECGNSNGSSVGSNGHCIRSGCSNPAVQSSEWENEYCSNECVVNHCRDVFSTWVAGNQNNSSVYPAPVK